jgi:CheY-like chemotaxis protein
MLESPVNDSKALILLVDDCVDTREMYGEFLSPSFDIIHAGTAQEALKKASELRPAAIVMDWMLPDMTGEEAIVNLRRDTRTDRIPIIVVSGFAEPPQKSPIWDAYLVKPCHPDTLSACLGRMIENTAAE